MRIRYPRTWVSSFGLAYTREVLLAYGKHDMTSVKTASDISNKGPAHNLFPIWLHGYRFRTCIKYSEISQSYLRSRGGVYIFVVSKVQSVERLGGLFVVNLPYVFVVVFLRRRYNKCASKSVFQVHSSQIPCTQTHKQTTQIQYIQVSQNLGCAQKDLKVM